MPKPNVKALAIWYADGRRDAAESYDADDFDLDKLAVAYTKAGADPATDLAATAAAAYESWFAEEVDEGTLVGWRKMRKDLVQEAEEVDGITPSDAYAMWCRGFREVIVHNLSDDILLEASEGDNDDDDDESAEEEDEDAVDEEDDDDDPEDDEEE